MYIASTKKNIPVTCILTHVAFGLFSWTMETGLLALSGRQLVHTINGGSLPASDQNYVFGVFQGCVL